MPSHRVHWDLKQNRVAELLESKRSSGTRVLDLTHSNPTTAQLHYAESEVLKALADPASLVYEPAPLGLTRTRAAVAELYGLDADRVIITASTSESYSYLFKALADSGDEILVPRPSYPLFELLATLDSLVVNQYSLRYHEGWFIDFESLAAQITPRTKAVVVVNPNNPTGSFLKRGELDRLVATCASRGLAIISDEVFSDYRFDDSPEIVTTLSSVSETPVFSLGGFSKMLGLPQMKLGWMILGGPEADRRSAKARIEFIADTYLSVGTPIQHATPRLLSLREPFQRELMQRLRGNLAVLRTRTQGTRCKVLDVEGGWSATLSLPRTRSEEDWVLEFLEDEGVLVQPGFFFDFEAEAYVVVSLLTPESIFAEGIAKLLARVNQG